MPNIHSYRWEYSPLARIGNEVWHRVIDPVLRLIADNELDFLLRTRGAIQIILVLAIALIPLSVFFHPTHLLVASGLLFDIAGVLRVFLLEELADALERFEKARECSLGCYARIDNARGIWPLHDRVVSVSLFYYKKRGVLFLFIGFVLQMIGDIVG